MLKLMLIVLSILSVYTELNIQRNNFAWYSYVQERKKENSVWSFVKIIRKTETRIKTLVVFFNKYADQFKEKFVQFLTVYKSVYFI